MKITPKRFETMNGNKFTIMQETDSIASDKTFLPSNKIAALSLEELNESAPNNGKEALEVFAMQTFPALIDELEQHEFNDEDSRLLKFQALRILTDAREEIEKFSNRQNK